MEPNLFGNASSTRALFWSFVSTVGLLTLVSRVNPYGAAEIAVVTTLVEDRARYHESEIHLRRVSTSIDPRYRADATSCGTLGVPQALFDRLHRKSHFSARLWKKPVPSSTLVEGPSVFDTWLGTEETKALRLSRVAFDSQTGLALVYELAPFSGGGYHLFSKTLGRWEHVAICGAWVS